MPEFGVKLMSELRGPEDLVRQAVHAEERAMDFVAISDHIHPWLGDHPHSPAAWPVLGAIASQTTRIGIATGVTCPIVRYHPVVLSHMVATVAVLSGGRFTFAIGAGERLNEHVLGTGWPPIDVRHRMLREAVAIMRQLWAGDFSSYRGEYFTAEDVRIYDLPDDPVPLVMAVSGSESIDVAAECAVEGIMATDPEAQIIDAWVERGGDRSMTYTEIPFAVAADEAEGLRLAHRDFRFSAPGWTVMSELPNHVNFDAATASVRPEDLADSIPHGPDPQTYIEAVQQFLDAGFEKISFVPVGDDLERFWSVSEKVTAALR